MLLRSARAQKYKAIWDTRQDGHDVSIEKDVTCLVGKNESGKTAFLESLFRLNAIPASGHRDTFVELYDYPRRRRVADLATIPQVKPIEARFELEPDDIAAIEKQFGTGVLADTTVTVYKNYKNERSWSIKSDDKAYVKHLLTDDEFAAGVTRNISTVEGLLKALKALEKPTPRQSELIKKLPDFDLSGSIREVLKERLPQFLYFDDYSKMPGRFSVPYLQNTPQNQLSKGERTALALLRLAGVDSKEFIADNYEARKAALEAAANQITQEVFEFWSQNRDLRVDFDIDFKSPPIDGKQPPFLDVRIFNNRHLVSLNFAERSTGFVWFFSFLAYFSEFRNDNGRLILLLDEPGLGLHAAAQADLLRFIDVRLAPNQQVIYSTHSPFMIKATALHKVRTVEDRDTVGTTISDDVLATNSDTIFPLQAALGYELSQTLFVGKNNLVVEGPSDILYLQILGNHLKGLKRVGLDERWTQVPAGGVDKIPTFVALLGTHLNLAVLMDGTTNGHQRIVSMVNRGILDAKKLFPLTDVTGTKEADIEDLFDVDFYLILLDKAGVATLKETELPAGTRIIKRIEQKLGCMFDHYAPAFYFLKEQSTLLPQLSSGTLDRFEALFTKLNAALTI